MAALCFAHIPNGREMGTWGPGRVCGPSSLMLHIPQLLRDTGHFPSSRQMAREGCYFTVFQRCRCPRNEPPERKSRLLKQYILEALISPFANLLKSRDKLNFLLGINSENSLTCS